MDELTVRQRKFYFIFPAELLYVNISIKKYIYFDLFVR